MLHAERCQLLPKSFENLVLTRTCLVYQSLNMKINISQIVLVPVIETVIVIVMITILGKLQLVIVIVIITNICYSNL